MVLRTRAEVEFDVVSEIDGRHFGMPRSIIVPFAIYPTMRLSIATRSSCFLLTILLWLGRAFPKAHAIWGFSRATQRPVVRTTTQATATTTTPRTTTTTCSTSTRSALSSDNDGESSSSSLEAEPLRPMILQAETNDDNESGVEGDSRRRRRRPILIVMDAFCSYHGVYLMRYAAEEAGAIVVPVLGEYLRKFLVATEPDQEQQWQAMRIPTTQQEAREWMSHLPLQEGDDEEEKNENKDDKMRRIAAVYCESDSGLEDAEYLRKLLNVTCQDDPTILPARRNKFLMNQRVHSFGLATARQKLCSSLAEARDFAQTLLAQRQELDDDDNDDGTLIPPRVIVKPIRSVASESVFLCSTLGEVQDAWHVISNSTVFGSPTGAHHETVLVQEYLQGTEYALDVVSRHGEHKIAAVWKYDKRPANGAPFCYFQTKLVDADLEPSEVPLVQAYVRQVLNALGIQYGLTHTEVIVTSNQGPVLVEVNCRQHNMDFAPLAMACIGYNALDMTVAALLEEETKPSDDNDVDEDSRLVPWDLYPIEPVLRMNGCMVHLVNYCQGVLRQVHYMDEMSQLPSFFQGHLYETFQPPGEDARSFDFEEREQQEIQPTLDIRSDAGWIQLLNEDHEELERDYQQIVNWMPFMFEVE